METAQPNPVPCKPLRWGISWKLRMLYCVYYDECLNVAVKKRWKNFSCVMCPFWDRKKRTVIIGDTTGHETRTDEPEEYKLLMKLEEDTEEYEY